MGIWDDIFAKRNTEYAYTFKCGRARVELRFTADRKKVIEVLGVGDVWQLLDARGPEVFPLITSEVHIIIKSPNQISIGVTQWFP